MDYRERIDDPVEAVQAAQDGRQAQIQTAMPGIIESYDAARQTCAVQPAIKGRVESPDGTVASVDLPLLVDVPVVFPSGGGMTFTFPVAAGDECLVVFASRCIDAWWQSGGVQEPLSARMHDLSDAIAIVGPRSQARKLADVSASEAQIRNDAGTLVMSFNPTTGAITMAVPGGLHVQGGITSTGDMVAGGISLMSHVHGGVEPGGGNTGGPA
jgi:hypothetical protein